MTVAVEVPITMAEHVRRTSNKRLEADVLVVGGGLAGLFAAINAKDTVENVVLVDKARPGRSGCSVFAAGIYNVFFPTDDIELWREELIEAGDYLNDQYWVQFLAEAGYGTFQLLEQWAAEYGIKLFEKDENGQFVRRKSRRHVHTSHCVVNSLNMMDVLRRKAVQKGVKLVERTAITDLVLAEDGSQVIGAIGLNCRTGDIWQFKAKSVVLAAGGCGFKSIFLGHQPLTGDLQAAAYRAGAVIRSMEQCGSNTCYRHFDTHGMNLMVSVGGKFINSNGEEFMWQYHPDLGNRAGLKDLVLAFCREVVEGRGPIYLDLSAASPDDQALCRRILPETFLLWDRAGINPFTQKLEWVPAFQGTIGSSGGVHIDLNGQTNIPGLYAAGDVTPISASGPSGLGGIPLNFCATSGFITGGAAARYAREAELCSDAELIVQAEPYAAALTAPLRRAVGIAPAALTHELQEIIIKIPVTYLKQKSHLEESLERLRESIAMLSELKVSTARDLVKANEIRSMFTMAELFLTASLTREESRGYHFREDFPRTDNKNWLKWVMQQKRSDGMHIWTQDIPLPYRSPNHDYAIPAGIRRG